MSDWFVPAPPEFQRKERAKARELRLSAWWKNQVGKGICHYCQRKFSPKDLTMDHLVPIARGGKSSRGNCVPACKECNSKKSHSLTLSGRESD